MSRWKACIGSLSPWLLKLPLIGILYSQRDLPWSLHDRRSNLIASRNSISKRRLGAGLGIFTAEECDVVLMGGITLGTQRGKHAKQEVVAECRGKLACR